MPGAKNALTVGVCTVKKESAFSIRAKVYLFESEKVSESSLL